MTEKEQKDWCEELYKEYFKSLRRLRDSFFIKRWDRNQIGQGIDLEDGSSISVQQRSKREGFLIFYVQLPKDGGHTSLQIELSNRGMISVGSYLPTLNVQGETVQLSPGLVYHGRSTEKLKVRTEQMPEFSVVLGAKLANWMADSLDARKIQPLNLSVNFISLPKQEVSHE